MKTSAAFVKDRGNVPKSARLPYFGVIIGRRKSPEKKVLQRIDSAAT